MIRIFYRTHRGAHKVKKAVGLVEAAKILENLWKARIKARAHAADSGKWVGGVWSNDGRLIWDCHKEEGE